MSQSIINITDYTSAGNWRRPAQLRGLLRNHPSLQVASAPLAAAGTTFASARVALHNSENALAVAVNPLFSGGSIGLLSLANEGVPSIQGASRMRWLDLPGDTRAACLDWCDDLLLVGSTRGKIFVSDMPVGACTQSSGLFEACGALETSPLEPSVGQITVPPSAHTVSTIVRDIRHNVKTNKSSLAAAASTSAYVWDLEGDALPVCQWGPHEDANDLSPVLFVRWAPDSASVVLTGTYDGTLMLTDTRAPVENAASNALQFATRRGFSVGRGEFSTVMPFSLAASMSDGTFSIFDVRYTSRAVLTVASLQGDVTALQWMKLRSDMLMTSGTDGSVSIWNLRNPPTYCVGRAQYRHTLVDLVTTETFAEERGFGVSLSGELTLTGMSNDALMALAPPVSLSRSTEDEDEDDPEDVPTAADGDNDDDDAAREAAQEKRLRAQERKAAGYLYARQLGNAYRLVADCAAQRFASHEIDRAMELVALIDVTRTPDVTYDELIRGGLAAAEDSSEPAAAAEGRTAFLAALRLTTERLCTTVPLHRIRALSRPDPIDMRQLEALRLNTVLHRVLKTDDVEHVTVGVRQALDLLTGHPESLELIDVDVVCSIVQFLLAKRFNEGEKFVRFLLRLLIAQGTPTTSRLARRIMNAVQEPRVTGNLTTKVARRFEERFYRNLAEAQDAVLTQLAVQKLGVENYHDVIRIVSAYEARYTPQKKPGVFGWLGRNPIALFLHSLTADSDYVTFFWVCVHFINELACFPGVRDVEEILFSVVNRIHTAATNIADDLDDLSDTDRFSIPLYRQADNVLRTTHGFLVVLLRVQLECENNAIKSSLTTLPPVMAKILDVLNSASEDVLDAWAALLDALMDGGQPTVVRKYCLAAVRQFSLDVEELLDVSAKKDDDERLNEILDVTDEFLDVIGHAR